ncbi:MAG: hypothetical protein IIY40_00865 [Firmicutes bacterium]|nr:hypothetical protein [Bacillota bacterium]
MNTESDNDTVRLVDVGIDNFDDLVDLAPLESRYDFVADNCCSLAEA